MGSAGVGSGAASSIRAQSVLVVSTQRTLLAPATSRFATWTPSARAPWPRSGGAWQPRRCGRAASRHLRTPGLWRRACRRCPLPAAASRSPSTRPAVHHAATRAQELSALFPAGEQSPLPSLPRLPPRKPPSGLRRKMVEHELPAYAVGNFHTLTFIMTRMPRRADFPHEWCADWPRAPALRAALSPPGVAQDLPAAEHRSPLQTLLQCKVAQRRAPPATAARLAPRRPHCHVSAQTGSSAASPRAPARRARNPGSRRGPAWPY